MELRPLNAKVTANGSGNKTNVDLATSVYICATADVLITNHTTGATLQMQEIKRSYYKKQQETKFLLVLRMHTLQK